MISFSVSVSPSHTQKCIQVNIYSVNISHTKMQASLNKYMGFCILLNYDFAGIHNLTRK